MTVGGRASRAILATGGVALAAATVLGALAAHALPGRISAQQLDVFDTAVRYHFYHALGLLAIGLTARALDSALIRWSAGLILAGIVLFSGSLYLLSLGAPRPIGLVTPLGGVALIVGWLVFALGALRAG
ncbi:MAG TPA: DUF423 domain-containing protein [Steroidobacteraceae bacterium]|nr:DUF423 domain-containing protein [Steroidobacteraceae bacterium]